MLAINYGPWGISFFSVSKPNAIARACHLEQVCSQPKAE